MAIDNSQPRLRLIATIAIIVVVTLGSLEFVFKSYFAYMTDEAKAEKIAPKTALKEQLLAEKEAFAGAKLPLDQAMSQIAKGTRPELIDPKPSDDLAAMTGWAKLPKALPVAAPSTTSDVRPAADAGAPVTDAGAATTDAAMPAPAKDAGVRPAPGH